MATTRPSHISNRHYRAPQPPALEHIKPHPALQSQLQRHHHRTSKVQGGQVVTKQPSQFVILRPIGHQIDSSKKEENPCIQSNNLNTSQPFDWPKRPCSHLPARPPSASLALPTRRPIRATRIHASSHAGTWTVTLPAVVRETPTCA